MNVIEADTTTHLDTTNRDDTDDLWHRFCKNQWEASKHGPATSRCGKTKTGWVKTTNGDDGMSCVVCIEMALKNQCAHCSKNT